VDKTRLFLLGALPTDYVASYCNPRGLDGVFLGHFAMEKERLIGAIGAAADDTAVGHWLATHVTEFERRRATWVDMAPRLGLPGMPMGDVFAWAKRNVYAHCDDPSCDTVFKLLDWDERRSVRVHAFENKAPERSLGGFL
jgi:hypothetical protein